jgi:hypothetical protein
MRRTLATLSSIPLCQATARGSIRCWAPCSGRPTREWEALVVDPGLVPVAKPPGGGSVRVGEDGIDPVKVAKRPLAPGSACPSPRLVSEDPHRQERHGASGPRLHAGDALPICIVVPTRTTSVRLGGYLWTNLRFFGHADTILSKPGRMGDSECRLPNNDQGPWTRTP